VREISVILASFRGARSASYDVQLPIGESVLPIVVMDSGLRQVAHPGMTGIVEAMLFTADRKMMGTLPGNKGKA